jgi:hypothetical protein
MKTGPETARLLHLPLGGLVTDLASSFSKPLHPPLPPARHGEHHAVVSQCGGRNPLRPAGFAEFGQDDWAGDAAVGGHRQSVAGVVVGPVEDLHVGVIGQPPVGDRPASVRWVARRQSGCRRTWAVSAGRG